MKVRCYAVLDAKIGEYHLAVFDIKDAGAIRQFHDALVEKTVKWSKHPEDYSLWLVGEFNTETGEIVKFVPQNLVNATAILSVKVGDDKVQEMLQ